MLKVFTWTLCALLLAGTQTTHTMDSVPKFLKSRGFWGTVALATVVSGTIYCIEYWQDAPNRELFKGVCEGDYAKVAQALSDGASIDRRAKDGSTLLHYAVRGGHYQLVPLLTHASLPSIIDIEDATHRTALQYAVEKEDALMVNALVHAGASKFNHNDIIEIEFEQKIAELQTRAALKLAGQSAKEHINQNK